VLTDIVRSKVQEEESDRRIPSPRTPLLRIHGGTDGDGDVTQQHSNSGSQPQEPPSQPFAQQGTSDGEDPVPNLKSSVKTRLLRARGDTDGRQDLSEVITDDSISDPLREKSDQLGGYSVSQYG
jgi:hypothetical protein